MMEDQVKIYWLECGYLGVWRTYEHERSLVFDPSLQNLVTMPYLEELVDSAEPEVAEVSMRESDLLAWMHLLVPTERQKGRNEKREQMADREPYDRSCPSQRFDPC